MLATRTASGKRWVVFGIINYHVTRSPFVASQCATWFDRCMVHQGRAYSSRILANRFTR